MSPSRKLGRSRRRTGKGSLCELQTDADLKLRLNAQADKIAPAFPPGVARPALRALNRLGISKVEHLVRFSEEEIAALHGMGPKALAALRSALEARGKCFRRRHCDGLTTVGAAGE